MNRAERTRLPTIVRRWSWLNGICLVALAAIVLFARSPLSVALGLTVTGLVQIAIGALLAWNINGLADEWAKWGRSRPALIGYASSSATLNRLQGAIAIAVGIGLIGWSAWFLSHGA